MRDAVLLTGGMVVQADTYHNPIFRESLKRMFLKDGEEGFIGITSNATMEVRGVNSLFDLTPPGSRECEGLPVLRHCSCS